MSLIIQNFGKKPRPLQILTIYLARNKPKPKKGVAAQLPFWVWGLTKRAKY
ncbi:hypothetical protein APA_4989 [Pseudanabaena sp. lw0831]|nr:hypothetical protein APA_4989 [Pseudanabaena sp. lw0831]